MDEDTQLLDLLLALFRSEAELRRFLALEKLLGPDLLPPAKRESSLSETAYQAAQLLVRLGRGDQQLFEALFDALERRSPERAGDIREVAAVFGAGPDRAPPPPVVAPSLPPSVTPAPLGSAPPTRQPTAEAPTAGGGGMTPEVADFASQLLADLNALEDPEEPTRALGPDHWPWAAAAAVLGSFRPSQLRQLAGTHPTAPALVALADLVFTSHDGSWVLQREFRIPCLQRLWDEGRFGAALDANRQITDLHRDLMGRLLDGWVPVLTRLDTRELDAVGVVAGWLEQVHGPQLRVSRAAINAAAERRLLIDPLRALVGTHFRGRIQEFAQVHNHLLGNLPEHILLIQGPGGAGKSTLVGKALLDLEDEATLGQPVSFAYIDFDRTRHDPHDPIGLLEQVARQLRLLYATAAEASQFAAVEAYGAGTDLEHAAEVLQVDRGRNLDDMVAVLAERLRRVQSGQGWARTPLVLVLDTFEEVQVKGPGATHDVLDLVARLQAALPDMRAIVAGRAVLHEFDSSANASELHLGDLDPEAADAVLEHLGVRDAELRQRVVERFGSNPLTLRLAAEALTGADQAEVAFDAVVTEAEALAKVSIELVQGLLYSRILGHIGDPDVVKVAYPGLAVRRVTVEVLREVLARPCGFDPDRAEDIFERLRDEVAMFDLEDPDTLRHRQDVRRLMLRTMLDDPSRARVVGEIHERAAAYYGSKPGTRARAEELYHRLMAGEDPRSLDKQWSPALNPLLASAMEEPLPPRAHSWLGRRLGLAPTDQERAEWDQEDWEGDAAARASSWLASNDLLRCLAVLEERPQRLQGSRLYAIEVAAATALGDLQRADEALEAGLRSAIAADDRAAQLELLERAITLRARQEDGSALVEAVRSAVALTDLTGQRARGIRALTDAAAALSQLGRDGEAATLNAEIGRRFASFDRADMRSRPDLVRRVLHTAGTTDSDVLVHAAAAVGDLTHAQDGVFVEDAFALRRLLQRTSSEAGPALAALADEVGLVDQRWKLEDLASRAVRVGRTGKAVAVGLDYAADDQAARRFVVDHLVRPIEPPPA